MRPSSSGTSDANSSASTTSMGFGTGGLRARSLDAVRGQRRGEVRGLGFEHDLAEQLALLRSDAALPHELEHREQRHHDVGALAQVRAQVLERNVLGGWQLAGGPAPDPRLLGLARAEPGAERLDARVFA